MRLASYAVTYMSPRARLLHLLRSVNLSYLRITMRAWPVARSIFDAPLELCERSERADNKLDNLRIDVVNQVCAWTPGNNCFDHQSPLRMALDPFTISRAASELFAQSCTRRAARPPHRVTARPACVSTWLGEVKR